MIAGDHIIIQAERIQHHLDSGKLIVGAEVGNVPAHYHKVEIFPGIDIPDASPEIGNRARTGRIMVVSNKGEPHRLLCSQ